MSHVVAILEDSAARIAAMRSLLSEALADPVIYFFDDAQQMIAWLSEHLAEVDLLSLDHDLPLRWEDGKSIDCGNGRQVVNYLASVPPTCPVIVHSSNDPRATAMFYDLRHAGWPCSRVYPCDGEAWIADAWMERVRRNLLA